MSDFTSIKFEVFNTAWVDITADVKANPRPRWNRGIMSNKPQDRVGSAGVLTFTLNNSAGNSAHLAGYYSPGHTNCWVGWTTGLKVRLSFGYDGVTYYKYYGRIKPDGLDIEPGIYGARTVGVTCGDWMYLAGQHEVKTLTYATNQKIGDVVTAVDANMPFGPLATTIATGVETFPTIFDITTARTTALAEYYKAAMSEWAYIYARGDTVGGENLVVENQHTRTAMTDAPVVSLPTANCGFILKQDNDKILKEDGDKIILNDTQAAAFSGTMSEGMSMSYGKTMANRINFTVYPRRVDPLATTVLWALQKSFKIKAGETIAGYRGQYRDPNNPETKVSGINMAAMVSGTDYTASANEDGTGANRTANLTVAPAFGSEAVIFQLSATVELWVQTLQVKGQGVYTDTTIQSMVEAGASQAVHGVIPLSLDSKYQTDARRAQSFASYIIVKDGWPRRAVDACPIWANINDLQMRGFLELEPGAKMTIAESQTAINGDYFINGYSAEIYNGKHVLWTPILKDDPGYFDFWKWDISQWDITTVWG